MLGIKEFMKPAWEIDTKSPGPLEVAYNVRHCLLAMAMADGQIVIVNTKNKAQTTLTGHDLGCSSLCWSPDANMLVSIGQDGRLRWWDAVSLKKILDLPSGAAWGVKVTFSPDGKYLGCAAGKKLTIWDAQGKMVCQYPDHASTIAGIAWRPRLEQIISCCYGVINFWEIGGQSAKRKFPWKGSMLTMALSPDGKYIATGDQDASVHFWDIKSGNDLMMSGYQTKVKELSWSFDSRFLATGGARAAIVWDCSGKGPAKTKPLVLGGPQENVSIVSFAPRKTILAVGSKDGLLFIWDVLSTQKPLNIARFKSEIAGIIWEEADKNIIVIDTDGVVACFNYGQIINNRMENL